MHNIYVDITRSCKHTLGQYATIIGTSEIKIALPLGNVSGILSTNHFLYTDHTKKKKIKTQIFTTSVM